MNQVADESHRLNALLIGAARSGTTALVSQLRRHPDVFVTQPKETNFFGYTGSSPTFTGPGDEEMITRTLVTAPADLERSVGEGAAYPIRLEGSVSTLYLHHQSIANIERYAASDVRFVVMLRDPAERAFSSYLYLVGRGHETAPTFEDALDLESSRVADGWHHLWHYRRMSRYAEQLGAFVDHFGRDRIWVGLHEDFEQHPDQFMRSVLEFLDLDPSRAPAGSHVQVNRGGIPRSRAVGAAMSVVRRSPRLENLARRLTSESLRERVRSANLSRPELSPATRQMLVAEFEEDIEFVEGLVDRRLDAWKA